MKDLYLSSILLWGETAPIHAPADAKKHAEPRGSVQSLAREQLQEC